MLKSLLIYKMFLQDQGDVYMIPVRLLFPCEFTLVLSCGSRSGPGCKKHRSPNSGLATILISVLLFKDVDSCKFSFALNFNFGCFHTVA